MTSPLRVGISACLLGQEVRFDGGHKRDRYLTDTLGQYFTWVEVCPEFELGLGVPRETLRLEGTADAPRLVFRKSREDITERMAALARKRAADLASQDLDGFILKSDSPSCGMERVRVYAGKGPAARNGVGLFARALMDNSPLLPIEEEGRLNDLPIRENFIERVFCYRRWREGVRAGFTRGKLVAFHTAHKFLLLAHSPKHYVELGRLVAGMKPGPIAEVIRDYGALFMTTLRVKSTAKKHANVLQHLMGFLKNDMDRADKTELLALIDDHRRGLAPLVVPLTLLKHHLARVKSPYISEQIYLSPHPKELMLRNHV